MVFFGFGLYCRGLGFRAFGLRFVRFYNAMVYNLRKSLNISLMIVQTMPVNGLTTTQHSEAFGCDNEPHNVSALIVRIVFRGLSCYICKYNVICIRWNPQNRMGNYLGPDIRRCHDAKQKTLYDPSKAFDNLRTLPYERGREGDILKALSSRSITPKFSALVFCV